MCSLDGLDVEVESLICGVGSDCGISGVGEGTALAIAETGDIVFVAAEGRFAGLLVSVVAGQLKFEGAELLVDDVPHYLVGRHSKRLLDCTREVIVDGVFGYRTQLELPWKKVEVAATFFGKHRPSAKISHGIATLMIGFIRWYGIFCSYTTYSYIHMVKR